MAHEVQIGSFKVGAGNRPFLIAGPCVIESEQLVLETAARIAEIAQALGMPYILNLLSIRRTGPPSTRIEGRGWNKAWRC